jgi:serine protease Do
MKLKKLVILIAVNLVISGACFIVFSNYILKRLELPSQGVALPVYSDVRFARSNGEIKNDMTDLSAAAKSTVVAVVYVKAKFPAQKKDSSKSSGTDIFIDGMLGPGMGSGTAEQRTSGSGVIISEDGYIVTNTHVVTDEKGKLAPEVMVTLRSKKQYKANIIGVEQDNDIAVLKIEADDLPFVVYCNSKTVELGEWVLAVGYPLSLDATVTAGIVSATGKRIMQRRSRNGTIVQSFIQTDAAVNSGSSGGALVNADGELVGITSAIFTTTRNYTGYSFAIPVSVVKKIVNEMIEK